ncbi:UDP-4-amino-4-deoxy-L-arabinose--oxoglutarate aminotransferase [Brevundimonas diminuta]|uniref:DegT/DnrJ/EryC1/StrS family aminotransferase n=1 Tax=Brevundimonas diminuta TaxID=293 RepID=UPI000207F5B1|nr:DegT/DnrJ/EryC1/StrS aminotransferase family protein [Brevundimonas diminuta]EGF95705.1 erythromycin biosynthesis sensory transduction protein eryC1 [Brevundimonas diminuta ATCC 11568]MBD3819147.1 DegT/DnrJ/EryC1/StrS aminotransferase family protein [Brevundimonas diminuta]OWR21134.1 aminotransferase DegT [Brevundimonas diminuta]WQE45484.1 DegT/DnrJ/EryC1/StrS aminotransferase family protein [Brevundimonas diminuta]SPU44609.1 UDP-4-amino-4-deoxy-L-arabinose--oxoglutarate aminotransferase [B
MTIPFIDLLSQRRRIGPAIDAALMEVAASGQYIMGPAVGAFEQALCDFGEAPHALSCSNGTDALVLLMMAWGVGPGDAVFCPAFTFAATAEVVALAGATPVFVDIRPDTWTIDPDHLRAAVEAVEREGVLTPRAVIAVDLFGQPADYPALSDIAQKHGLKLIADSAQGFGCTLNGRHPIHWADATTLSFFPAKPLGAYGDGGAVLMKDEALMDHLVSLRVHGQATAADAAAQGFAHDPKYLNPRLGMNGRMDTLQAAVLLEKLKIFPDEIDRRNRIADRYVQGLAGHVATTPVVIPGGRSVWAQFTVEHDDRDALAAHLKAEGVPTAVYYPIPLHRQPAYRQHPVGPRGLAVTEAKAERVISLPMSAYLDEAVQDRVIAAVAGFG